MISGTDVFHSGGGAAPPTFNSRRPGLIQELGYKTPFDHGDRWQLSKLCKKLGIPHLDAETKVMLLHALSAAAQGGYIDVNKALGLLNQIIAESMPQPSATAERRWVDLEAPSIMANGKGAPAAEPVTPPSPESELWRFAKMTTSELITEGAKIGITFKRTDKRAFIMEELEKALKK